jgi:hypothetical protein
VHSPPGVDLPMDYAIYETAVQNMAKSELEDVVLGLLTEISNGCMSSVGSVRDYLTLNIERNNRTRRQREASAACAAAAQAPKRKRKDSLVPLCSGPKMYGCTVCNTYSNKMSVVKSSCRNADEHLAKGFETVSHVLPDTYDPITATCEGCRKPVPLCGGPHKYGCPKCGIYTQTPEDLILECRARGCPYHEHIPCNRTGTVLHRFKINDDDKMCRACRPRSEAQLQQDAKVALETGRNLETKSEEETETAKPVKPAGPPRVPPQWMVEELFVRHKWRVPIAIFHQFVRDHNVDNEESWGFIRNMLSRMGVRRDSQNRNYVLNAK